MSPKLRGWLILTRGSNLPTVWSNVIAGWLLAQGLRLRPPGSEYAGQTPDPLCWGGLLLLLLGVSLTYVGGMILNDAFDAVWDREHAVSRPIPAGRIGRGAVWMIGLIEMAVGIFVLAEKSSAHPLLVAGLVGSILLYNVLHKRWAGSVLIMGLCRALVYVGAGSAVAHHTTAMEVSPVLCYLSGGVVLYIAGLTLVARKEHLPGPTALRLAPRLMLMLPVLFPLIASRGVETDPVRLALVAVGVLGTTAWLTIVRRSLAERVPKGIAFAIAGIALYDAAVVVFADGPAAIFALVCFVLTLGLQRVVPAT